MSSWQIWIDRGGTFTDCIGFSPATGELRVAKVLSSDDAPLHGIRALLRLSPQDALPAVELRMGTTLATNALLERRGAPTALVITRGFADLIEIGDQTRPDLFALDIVRPSPLPSAVLETEARRAASGEVLAGIDRAALEQGLRAAQAAGCSSVAVVIMHDYAEGTLERQVVELSRELGVHVSASHEVAPQIGLLGRAETTVVDAYLTPLLTDYLAKLTRALPGSRISLMQSNGALTSVGAFRGRDAVLSGPAGGVVALADLAETVGEAQVIGFDMGGTSTDVSRYAGAFEHVYETKVAGVRLRTPMMDLHTIAAGGGSYCRCDGVKLMVGPESAGARPGPLCYGDARAAEPALSDAHLVLGRLTGDRFPFALDQARAEAAFTQVAAQLGKAQEPDCAARVAEGYFDIAVESMADAIRRVTIARGHDVREHALVVFGGAGGQAACAVARKLGIKRLYLHPLAGVLSAYGMGVAKSGWHGVTDLGAAPLTEASVVSLEAVFEALETRGKAQLAAELASGGALETRRLLELRYAGTETALAVEPADLDLLRQRFFEAHRRAFGYARPEHAVELVAARSEVHARPARALLPVARAAGEAAAVLRKARLFYRGSWLSEVPVLDRAHLGPGTQIKGPALLLDAAQTFVLEPGFAAEVRVDGILTVTDEGEVAAPVAQRGRAPDPVLLEVFANQFMSIAEQMGGVLKRTALSTNIRERMDFSCAVFDAVGGLVANAPHIPVHLGAMSESVQAVLRAHPELLPGDVYVTNDPSCGGSHLPDITVVSPVHDAAGRLRFLCASRGHHADVGGITPGSMPPFSRTLEEEGVVLSAVRLVHRGVLAREALLASLRAGPYPARNVEENLADLEAQIAANRTGAELLGALERRFRPELVADYMRHIQDDAARLVEAAITALPQGVHDFEDALDDGSVIRVRLNVAGGRMDIDFSGTSAEHPQNFNAPRAVTVAAVLYVLRCLVGKPIPLCGGCLRPITLRIPRPSLLDPSPGRAVVAGNVETSQRVVDVLLGALSVAAASQGTMNNLTFGTSRFAYYETLAGGAGATANAPGASAVHTHMTNTRITDPEILERRFPVRLWQFAVRRGSGGRGAHQGGDGLVRELELLEPMTVSLLAERRLRAPFGLCGGEPGQPGRSYVGEQELPARASVELTRGARVRIETPGGGGFGAR